MFHPRIDEILVVVPLVECIFQAFEEEGWPQHLDDPLPPRPGRRQKERLRETIYSINRRLPGSPLRFEADGYGQGIVWRVVEA